MAKYCPITRTKVVYLDCQECDDRICRCTEVSKTKHQFRSKGENEMERTGKRITHTSSECKTNAAVIARYLADNEAIAVMQYPNGKFYNHYGYDAQSGSSASVAGGFDAFGEAERALYAHRKTAKKIIEPNAVREEPDHGCE